MQQQYPPQPPPPPPQYYQPPIHPPHYSGSGIMQGIMGAFVRMIIGFIIGVFFSAIVGVTIFPSMALVMVFMGVTTLVFVVISALSTRYLTLCIILLLCSIPSIIVAYIAMSLIAWHVVGMVVFFSMLIVMTRIFWVMLRKYVWRDLSGPITWFPVIQGFIQGFKKGLKKPEIMSQQQVTAGPVEAVRRFGRR